MTLSGKIIGSIALIGVIYSIVRLFEGGSGGGSLENAYVGIMYTIVAVFISSLLSVIINRKRLKEKEEEVYLR
jgi:hypothetical protein